MRQLKKTTIYNYDLPNGKTLDTFPNPGVKRVEMECIEFTSLCPVTGQPDYGEIKIVYEPMTLCVESKSLKLYLGSYRMYGGFAETLTLMIYADLLTVLRPKFLEVEGKFTYRGGISIKATVNSYQAKQGA